MLLAIYLCWSLLAPTQSISRELVLYNLIWFAALLIILTTRGETNHVAIGALGIAILFWGIGSLIASYGQFFTVSDQWGYLPEIFYIAFYPLALLALIQISKGKRPLEPLETLDSLICGLGFSSLIATGTYLLIFRSIDISQVNYLHIYYPIADITIFVASLIVLIKSKFALQLILFTSAISIFSAADLYYLWITLNQSYQFGTFLDSIWIFAIYLFSLSQSDGVGNIGMRTEIPPILVAISIFLSPILIAMSALRPDLFPLYLLIPTIANLLLAFIRMNSALTHARTLSDERTLARTDELTGLPNRRKLIHELSSTSDFEGALLLMDLNQFKPLNDQYGHAFGDLVLREVAKRFSRALPGDALLARLGGDEFGVIVRGSYEETLEAAHALHASLSYPLIINGSHIRVGVSIGHVYNDGAGELLKRADIAMYRAKQMDMGVAQS